MPRGIFPRTEEHKKHQSESAMGKKGTNKGKKFSQEWKDNIKKSLIGKCNRTKEQNERQSKKMLGRKATLETLEKISKSNIGKHLNNGKGYGKQFYYDSPLQGKIRLRSSYELAYAKYLDYNNILWLYEMETFDLGTTTYTPDFYLPKTEKFIEIKGYMRPEAKKKIDMFNEQYPWDLEVLYGENLKLLGIKI